MRFQVPQFIEVEDKIFGPFTLKQFIYLAGAAGIVFLLYVSLPLFFAILAGIPVAIFALALAFYRMDDQPFIDILQAAFFYTLGGKLYIWKSRPPKQGGTKGAAVETPTMSPIAVPKLSHSKLKDLAWSLDIKESIYSDQNQR